MGEERGGRLRRARTGTEEQQQSQQQRHSRNQQTVWREVHSGIHEGLKERWKRNRRLGERVLQQNVVGEDLQGQRRYHDRHETHRHQHELEREQTPSGLDVGEGTAENAEHVPAA